MSRLGVLLDVGFALALVAAMAFAARAATEQPWREHQRQYHDLVRRRGTADAKRALEGERVRPHEVSIALSGAVDRCTTCHLGMEPGAQSFEDVPLFRPHPGDWLESHPIGRFGCTSCHGGQGRALDHERAHDRRHRGGPDAFVSASVRCSRCHPAAGLDGTELVSRGVGLFFEHGCSGCHQPGRAGPGIGPSLATIGLRGGSYIRDVVLDPDKVYPQTIMPPMRHRIPRAGREIDALVAYLRTLEPWPAALPRAERRFDPRACTGCHRVDEPGQSPSGPGHRCTYLHDEADWLTCGRCHLEPGGPARLPSEVPALGPAAGRSVASPEGASWAEHFRAELGRASGPARASRPDGTCPEIDRTMGACGVCHREGEHER